MIKTEFKPLPQAALEKLIEAGNYVLEGKHSSYFIDYYEPEDEDDEDENVGAISLTAQDGSDFVVVTPDKISYSGAWIRVFDNEGYQCDFTLEKRVTTFVEDIEAELN
jgi:hypothetical protein